jgi:hypothetical protein
MTDLLNKSDSSNNNNDNNNLLNNLLNKYKSYLIKSFSVKAEFYPFFAKFLEKCEMEHWDFSYAVNLAIKEFVERHCVPNPQMTLDRGLELGLPAKAHDVCCVPGCKRKAKYILRLGNYNGKVESFQVCEGHKEWRHRDYRFLMNFKQLDE